MATEKLQEPTTVYVVGAGFSAGLEFPLVHDLLVRLWPRLPKVFQKRLGKVISFHHPGFDSKRKTSYPTVEHLLSEMMANEQLFDASRVTEGRFKYEDLVGIRQEMLLQIAQWFHEIHKNIMTDTPDWLPQIVNKITREKATVISFNWDLVLDQMFYGDDLAPASYGLAPLEDDRPRLLKPHGSLNWFRGPTAKLLKAEKRFLLHSSTASGKQEIYAFKPYRSPKSTQRTYMPLIIPPVYGKTFELAIFRELWRASVDALSTANDVIFLGYSLPDADLHAKFILRCGFHNQVDGKLTGGSSRSPATGPAKVLIINPDAGSARRIEATVGGRVDWEPIIVANWVKKNAAS